MIIIYQSSNKESSGKITIFDRKLKRILAPCPFDGKTLLGSNNVIRKRRLLLNGVLNIQTVIVIWSDLRTSKRVSNFIFSITFFSQLYANDFPNFIFMKPSLHGSNCRDLFWITKKEHKNYDSRSSE